MNKLSLIISQEYKTDVTSKSFWISTILVPVLLIGFGVFIGFLAADSDSFNTMADATTGMDDKDLSGTQVIGMMCGILLTFFVMTYGAIIFNKVKVEKCNRIIEVLATCVTGRTMMLAKIISVGLIGLTQMCVWGILVVGGLVAVIFLFGVDIPWQDVLSWRVLGIFLWCVGFFLGGYVFYGSLFAACGATTDRNNENQEYMTILTFILLGSFYIGIFAVDHPTSVLAMSCSLIPFTSTTCGVVGAVSGQNPLWFSLLSLAVLWGCSAITLSLAGKIYTSSLLLMGKKLTPKDIITFLKAK